MKTRISIEGRLPKELGLPVMQLKNAAQYFSGLSGARCGEVFREVTIIIQNDTSSGEVHKAIMNDPSPTDVITQRYDAIPGEESGVYGELYVNAERAASAAPKRKGWSKAKEFLLYVAHGIDHLSGADDISDSDYKQMRARELKWIASFAAQSISVFGDGLATITESTKYPNKR